jgi:hypothetical protein
MMTSQELAGIRRKAMAPLGPDAQVTGGLEGRSPERSILCKTVVEKAKEISHKLVIDCQWRECFNSEKPSFIRQRMEESDQIQAL